LLSIPQTNTNQPRPSTAQSRPQSTPQPKKPAPQLSAPQQTAHDPLGLGDLASFEQSTTPAGQDPLATAPPATTPQTGATGKSAANRQLTPSTPQASTPTQQATKKRFNRFWILGLGIGGLAILSIVALVVTMFLLPTKNSPSQPLFVDQPKVEKVWVVLSEFNQQAGAFSIDWRVAHGPIDAKSEYYWIVESSSPSAPDVKYLSFPVDLNQQQGKLEGTSKEVLELEPDGYYTSYIASKQGSEFEKVSGILKLGEASKQTAAQSLYDTAAPTDAGSEVLLSQPRVVQNSADQSSLLMVDFEISDPPQDADVFLVIMPQGGGGLQFEATANLRERVGTLTGNPVHQQVFQHRPLQIFIEARPRNAPNSATTISNILNLN
jgi:hypothetical protein